MRRINTLLFVSLVTPLFGQLQTRPPVLQLSMKQAVELALAPEGSTRVKLAEEILETGRGAGRREPRRSTSRF